MIIFAPVRGPPKARPQELAWNMGTTARTVLVLPILAPSGITVTMACRKLDRWLYKTPCTQQAAPGCALEFQLCWGFPEQAGEA
jgi:hypothetical protein